MEFDLKNYLRNNLLFENTEEIKEEEEVKEGYGKMKRSALKEKIREEILEALSRENDDPTVGDEEEANSGVAEAEGDEDDAPEADIDVDADIDIEEPSMDDEVDQFAGAEELKDPSQVREKAIPAWKEIGRAGEATNDESLIKMATDGLAYTNKHYPDPTPFDEQ